MITFNDLKPYIQNLGLYDKLCIFDYKTDELLDTIYINPKDNKLYEYVNIFISHEINEDEDCYYFFKHIKKEECYFRVLPVEDWCLYKRKRNYDNYVNALEEEGFNNAKIILDEIRNDQGKYVCFSFCEELKDKYKGILITVVASDEDYYYVYLKDNKLELMTCVSGYKVIESKEEVPYSDEEIGQMLYDKFENRNSTDAVIYWGKYQI